MHRTLAGLLLAALLFPGAARFVAAASPGGRAPHELEALTFNISDGESGVRPDRPLVVTLNREHPGWRGLAAHVRHGRFSLEVDADGFRSTVSRSDIALLDEYTVLEYLPAGGWSPLTRYLVRVKVGPTAIEDVGFATGPALHEPESIVVESPGEGEVGTSHDLVVRLLDHYGLPAWGVVLDVSAREYGSRQPGSLRMEPTALVIEQSSRGEGVLSVWNAEAEAVEITFRPRAAGPPPLTTQFHFHPGSPDSVEVAVSPRMATVGEPVLVAGRVFDAFRNACPGVPANVEAVGAVSGGVIFAPEVASDATGCFETELVGESGEEYSVTVRSGGIRSEPTRVIWYSRGADGAKSYCVVVAGAPVDGPVIAVAPRTVSGSAGSAAPGSRIRATCDGAEVGSCVSAQDGSFELTTVEDIQVGKTIHIIEEAASAPRVYTITGNFGWGATDPDEICFSLGGATTISIRYHSLEQVNRDYHERNLYFVVRSYGGGSATVYSGGGDYEITLPAGTYRVTAKSSLGCSRATLTVIVP
ncbi:MAG: hypothetical protein NUV93_01305 [Firmicutes bacterium]|nr:hypothetical protein [Bacillota bacterium]